MPKLTPLPSALLKRPFAVREGPAHGILSGRMRSRDLARPYRGVRIADSLHEEDEDALARAVRECEAYASRMRPTEMFWGASAARLWGAPLPHRMETRKLELAVCAPLNATREPNVRGHQVALRHGTICQRARMRVADPATTWLSLATQLSLHDLVAVGDYFAHIPPVKKAGVRRPFFTLEELARRVEQYRGRGKRRASEALKLVCTGAESRPETLLRLLICDAGLPSPEVNPEISDARGDLIGRADLVFRAAKVIVEYDGDQHRTDTRQYAKDMVRLERFHLEEWRVLRFRTDDLFHTPRNTLARIRSALVRDGALC